MHDVTQWVLSHYSKGGTFVEAGAHDGYGDSQTYELEQLGWTGLCIEPSSSGAGMSARRKCKTDRRALWSNEGVARFREVCGNAIELSGIDGAFHDTWDRTNRTHMFKDVPCARLHTVLRDHGMPSVIELLALDTEGSEFDILEAHDFTQYRFGLIQVEHNGVEAQRDKIKELLTGRGYLFQSTDGINDRYKYRSLSI